jgi:hypothetical protein
MIIGEAANHIPSEITSTETGVPLRQMIDRRYPRWIDRCALRPGNRRTRVSASGPGGAPCSEAMRPPTGPWQTDDPESWTSVDFHLD